MNLIVLVFVILTVLAIGYCSFKIGNYIFELMFEDVVEETVGGKVDGNADINSSTTSCGNCTSCRCSS